MFLLDEAFERSVGLDMLFLDIQFLAFVAKMRKTCQLL